MKLSKRIRDLVRASLASPPGLSGSGKAKSPERMEAQLEQIRKSLVGAAAREKRLQDDLMLAEQEGRERDAIRLSRELNELRRSTDELQATLDVIEARIEVAHQSKIEATARPQPTETSQAAKGSDSPQISLATPEEEADLATRKARLATPAKRREAKAGKPDQSQSDQS